MTRATNAQAHMLHVHSKMKQVLRLFTRRE